MTLFNKQNIESVMTPALVLKKAPKTLMFSYFILIITTICLEMHIFTLETKQIRIFVDFWMAISTEKKVPNGDHRTPSTVDVHSTLLLRFRLELNVSFLLMCFSHTMYYCYNTQEYPKLIITFF